MATLNFDDFKKVCEEIDDQVFNQIQELILEKIPENNRENNHDAALMYIVSRIATKCIFSIYPDHKEKQIETITDMSENIKKFLTITKKVTVQ